ncbi:DUF6531 domain-containing protein [Streptomyces sp. NPDC006465]|uniref:RHS repeat-associated core domain-containing protein n=1 Tax=Streptomyces sp. NPDC006465 TaxID=3157174 RepID=UPI0033B86B3D
MAVCKVVVAVVGIIAMIIGGPILGAIVLIAALVVLADTLNKYAKGQASLWDVAFAALDCIPGMKGLTTLGGLAKGLKGGMAAMKGLKGGLKGMGLAARGLGKSARGAIADGAKGAYSRLKSKIKGCGDPVDVATGQMFLVETDVALPAALPLAFTRRVASGYRTGWWFGPSWASTIDQRLEVDHDGIVFVTEDGMLLAYPHPAGSGTPVLPETGPRWPLTRHDDGGYRVDDPLTGHARHFALPAAGIAPLDRIVDRNGNTITFDYDEYGTPLAIRHSGGYRLALAVEEGRVTGLSLEGGNEDGSDAVVKRYGYTDGNLTEVFNSFGRSFRFVYDERLRITSWTDTNHRRYGYAYDDHDRCTGQGGDAGHVSGTFSYGIDPAWPDCRITTHVASDGAVSRFVINNRCQVVAQVDPLGGIQRSEHDEHHRLLSWSDAVGHTTRVVHDANGQPTRIIRPDGRETWAEYNELRLITKFAGPDGGVHRQTYDDRGNRTSVTGPTGCTTHLTYDDSGRLSVVTDPLGHVTRVHCNEAGLPVRTTNPIGAVTRYERDAFGRTVAITDATGASSRLEWTVEGHLARRTAADGTTESWTYDGEGNCVSHTDAMGVVSRFEYTHFDLMTARTGPNGVRYEFTHDNQLRLRQVTNPQGLTWDYEYDLAGRLIAETDFDERALAYTYDDAGRLTSRTNGLGETIAYERNELGQVVRKDAAGRVTTYAYDLTDQLAQGTGPDITLTVGRDRFGRLRSETVDGRELRYTYDDLGRRAGRTTPTGSTATWAYDAAGRHTGVAVDGRTIDFTYDLMGRELTRQIAEMVALDQTFDVRGRVISQAVTAADGRSVQQRAYTYRADGNLIGMDDSLSGSRSFDVDPTGFVTAVYAANWAERYTYDDAGNQTSASWPAEHPGQEATGARTYAGTRISRAGNIRYEHDALGRIVLRQRTRLSRKPDTWRYEWDVEDRLTSVITPDGVRWRYLYDPLGRRTAKIRLADDAETVIERVDFVWDGTTLCEQTTTGQEIRDPVTLTWCHRGGRPITQTERITAEGAPQQEIDARFFAIVTNLVGAPSELVDEEGEIAWRTRSTLWGATAWAADSTAYTPLRFPGQYYDPETGLHYNYFRHYDPETARYLTTDPLGLAPSWNPATYVHNPHTWTDPLGLAAAGCAEEEYLFRGTTRGFDASSGAQGVGFTPTSTDPGVATAFARHSEQYGEAVVQVIPRSALDGVETARGYIAAEAEVAVGLPASELAGRVSAEIPVSVARNILGDMGIHVPKVNTYEGISDALQWDIPKLTPEQIAQFVSEAHKYG